jgi:hypothetical protein
MPLPWAKSAIAKSIPKKKGADADVPPQIVDHDVGREDARPVLDRALDHL